MNEYSIVYRAFYYRKPEPAPLSFRIPAHCGARDCAVFAVADQGLMFDCGFGRCWAVEAETSSTLASTPSLENATGTRDGEGCGSAAAAKLCAMNVVPRSHTVPPLDQPDGYAVQVLLELGRLVAAPGAQALRGQLAGVRQTDRRPNRSCRLRLRNSALRLA